MGRMLEVLKTRDANRPTLADTKEPPKLAGAEVVNEWSLREDEVPFIEVGANQPMTASPHVLAAPPQPAPTPPRREPAQQPAIQPPHPPTEIAIANSILANLLEPRPLSVNFEPYTALGEVGKIAGDIIAYHQPNSPIGQHYVGLVEKLLQDDAAKVLLLSGVRPSVGTSTVLLNLAVAAALKNQKRVAVVETQRQRPSLAAKLGVKPLAFLQDVLSGTVSIEQALLKSPLPRLALLAASASHPEVLLAVEGLTWLLTWLKQRNDLVLVDGPSLDEQNDLARIAPLSDSLFLVMPQGEPATQTRGLLQTIARIGGRLRGLLHTQLAS
jgi:Mrp family chromosome partitioning ATPase